MFVIEIVLVIFFSLFFLISVLYQFFSLRKKIRKYDYLNIIPTWTFFAPNPVKHDYHLLYRNKENNNVSKWKEVPLIKKKNNFSFIWNPERRIKKSLLAIANSLGLEIRNYKKLHDKLPNASYLVSSVAYQTCLNIVLEAPISKKVERQFMIVQSKGMITDEKPEIILISLFHKIDV